MTGQGPNSSHAAPLMPGQAQLTIPELFLFVRLGLGETERLAPQKVSLFLRITFKQAPGACSSDDINETLCYHTLRDEFRALVESKHYKLIEHLGECLLQATIRILEARRLVPAIVHIDLHKLSVPLVDVPHGAIFSMVRSVGAATNEFL